MKIFYTNRIVRPGKGNTCHSRGFHCQCSQVFRLQTVQISLAAGAGEELRFDSERMQKIVDPLSGFIRIESCPQHRILRCHAHWTATGMAMIAITTSSSINVNALVVFINPTSTKLGKSLDPKATKETSFPKKNKFHLLVPANGMMEKGGMPTVKLALVHLVFLNFKSRALAKRETVLAWLCLAARLVHSWGSFFRS